MKKYAISNWESAQEINANLKKLTSEPIYKVSEAYYKDTVLKYFNDKCAKSKAITDEAKTYIPGGVQHNLAFNKPFPICVSKAEGSYLYDIDGNKYIDFLQAGGPTVLGSNHPAIREEVIKLLQECGPVTGLFHEAELLLAKEINKHMPAVEMFRMLGSGTEAVMAATRVARLVTGKSRIIKMGGAYHGWSDQMVYGLKIPGTRRFLESHGIHKRLMSLTDEVRPNDLEMLKKMLTLNKLRGGTAAVIVEPVGPESGTRPVDFDYNQKAQELCKKFGALFIFDEVVTGFRVGLGGAQGYFGVQPDLTIFGKVIAGGYPAAGGIGGKKEYIQRLAAGIGGLKAKAYCGGTLAANPLSSYAGYLTIKEIERTNASVKAGEAGDKLAKGLKELIAKYKLPYVVYNQGSIVHLECTGAMSFDFSSMFLLKSLIPVLKHKKMMTERKVAMEEMGAAYMANGIVTLAGSRLYTSLATTDEVIADALQRFEKVFREVVRTDDGLMK
ncbi:MAG: aminotransferase class III-fold pyridoxal phosphate-dependent enzyme [Clostridia bacterium]|nr:aminotransferase class III-fold pyridoxal phosphate-dependent enzyme [Clostridia bacterium]